MNRSLLWGSATFLLILAGCQQAKPEATTQPSGAVPPDIAKKFGTGTPQQGQPNPDYVPIQAGNKVKH